MSIEVNRSFFKRSYSAKENLTNNVFNVIPFSYFLTYQSVDQYDFRRIMTEKTAAFAIV